MLAAGATSSNQAAKPEDSMEVDQQAHPAGNNNASESNSRVTAGGEVAASVANGSVNDPSQPAGAGAHSSSQTQ